MFKKVKPRDIKRVNVSTPHRDARVLHAPGECRFCDNHADWQALRQMWGICFTGYTPEADELACPSEVDRYLL